MQPSVAISGNQWPSVVIKGKHLWPEDDCMRAVPNRGRCPASKRRIHGVLRLPIIDAVEVISGHQWSSVVISVHQCSSVVISGHQWASVVISEERRRSHLWQLGDSEGGSVAINVNHLPIIEVEERR